MVGMKKFGHRAMALWRDRRGITGLETAIVLIAFVVVAAVFAFAVLSTGLLSSEKSKETVLGGLSETAASLALRGSVIAAASGGEITTVTFQVSNASQSGDSVNLAKTGVDSAIISYVDDNQAVNLSAAQWTATWLIGSGDLLDAGERVEIQISLSGGALGTALGTSTRFKVEVKPTRGATLVFERTTPAELKTVNDLG